MFFLVFFKAEAELFSRQNHSEVDEYFLYGNGGMMTDIIIRMQKTKIVTALVFDNVFDSEPTLSSNGLWFKSLNSHKFVFPNI